MSTSAVEPPLAPPPAPVSMANPVFFLAFFKPAFWAATATAASAGGSLFCGVVVDPEGGTIFPDAGRRGRGRFFSGRSTSSASGSPLLACSFDRKKSWTIPICDETDSEVTLGYGGGGGKRVTDCEMLERREKNVSQGRGIETNSREGAHTSCSGIVRHCTSYSEVGAAEH